MILVIPQSPTQEIQLPMQSISNNFDSLLNQISPPFPIREQFSNSQSSLKWLKTTIKMTVEAKKQLDKTQLGQAITISKLKQDRKQIEIDLSKRETIILRELLQNPSFELAIKKYRDQASLLFEKIIDTKDDEQGRISRIQGFIMQSEQKLLNETGRPFESRTIRLPTGDRTRIIDIFDTSYKSVWEEFKMAFQIYNSKIRDAELAVGEIASGSAAEAILQKLIVKRLQLILSIQAIHQRAMITILK